MVIAPKTTFTADFASGAIFPLDYGCRQQEEVQKLGVKPWWTSLLKEESVIAGGDVRMPLLSHPYPT